MTSLVTELNEDYRRVMRKQIGVIIAAEEWRDAITDKGGVCLENAVALESMFPGELSSKAALNTFTVSTSRTNYVMALESSDNIITRAVTAIINAFRDFFSRIVGWFKQMFAGKPKCNPAAASECVSKPVGSDIYPYMDKYPGIVTDYLKSIHEDLAPHAGLSGGKLLESFFHSAMVSQLQDKTTLNIVHVVEDTIPGITTAGLKSIIVSFASYVDQITATMKEARVGGSLNMATQHQNNGNKGPIPNLTNALKEVRAKFIKLPMTVGDGNVKLDLTTSTDIVLKGVTDGSAVAVVSGKRNVVEDTFANITKFYSFFDTGNAKAYTDITLDKLQDEVDKAIDYMRAAGNAQSVSEIPGIQSIMQDALVLLSIMKRIGDQCNGYAKAHIDGLIGRHKAMLALLAMVEKSPIALPADVRGMAKTKSDIETTIKSLEKSL